jgi:hypothetical protein
MDRDLALHRGTLDQQAKKRLARRGGGIRSVLRLLALAQALKDVAADEAAFGYAEDRGGARICEGDAPFSSGDE